ncbi:MAG: response regulator [Planctomycetes bacterium]|nr:response regulator [Planctomycetota bacterium]MCB9886932.1 response regulator [Planctomycetota bacterium]
MVRVLLAVCATGLGVMMLRERNWSDGSRLAVVAAATVLVALGAFAPKVGWRTRAWLVATTIVGTTTAYVFLHGFLPANVFVGMTSGAVMIASCLGVRAATLTLALFGAGYAAAGYAHVTGAIVFDHSAYDQTVAGNWVRVGIIYFALSMSAILFVATMLRRLGEAMRRGDQLLAQTTEQTRLQLESAAQHARLQADLQQAQKFEALGRLAGGVAHDLNNLLVVIQNNASWIAKVGDEEAKEAAREIEQAGDRATKLARNLLVFGSQQANQLEPLDLDAAVQSSLRLIRKMLPPDVHLHFEPGGCGTVRSCGSDLDQVLINLCTNARDAMPAGGVITVSTAREIDDDDPANSRVVLRVTDQGHGIPEAVRPRIFEPFFTTKDRRKGTGLGLAVVHGIVKQHGGKVTVVSTIGKGTTFEVRLPTHERTAKAAAPTPQQAAPRQSAPRAAAASAEQRSPATILVLEDDDKVRKIVANVLRNAGHEVHEFAMGRDLLEWCRQDRARADLLVTDVNLTEHNGIEVYRHARLLLPDLSCLVCSGSYANPVDPDFFTEPKHGRLDKPFRSADLLESVHRLLDAHMPRS